MHIELFRDSQDSYLRALQEFQVTAIQRQPRPGLIVNSGFRFFVEKVRLPLKSGVLNPC